ncbi:hypothetical protein J2847_003600 [Azospirillum agricola]|uniref:hypothetical protein n=1 Tax=Azospirillum agricola TaxID=1720247 RepID=UPI001AE28DD2|nr:hypothetical protein [Azospirillum agricola]MBP2230297.1 hypothetical protein [Azospirillum agricola]
MLRFLPVLALVLATGACTAIVQLPVTGTVGDRTSLNGFAVARSDTPLGRYAVQTADRTLSCNGVYDASSNEPRMIVAVSCDDGRFGAVDVRRTPDLMSGTGSGRLNDGTPIKVAFSPPPKAE